MTKLIFIVSTAAFFLSIIQIARPIGYFGLDRRWHSIILFFVFIALTGAYGFSLMADTEKELEGYRQSDPDKYLSEIRQLRGDKRYLEEVQKLRPQLYSTEVEAVAKKKKEKVEAAERQKREEEEEKAIEKQRENLRKIMKERDKESERLLNERKQMAPILCMNAVENASQFPTKAKVNILSTKSSSNGMPLYMSGRAELMNGFGNMIPHKFICSFNPDGTLKDFGITPG